jgi:thioredoxin 1
MGTHIHTIFTLIHILSTILRHIDILRHTLVTITIITATEEFVVTEPDPWALARLDLLGEVSECQVLRRDRGVDLACITAVDLTIKRLKAGMFNDKMAEIIYRDVGSSAPTSRVVVAQTTEEFFSLLGRNPTCVADFYANWCKPCHIISPKYDAMSLEPDFKDVVFIKINIDNVDDATRRQLKTYALPLFIMFKNGVEVAREMGASDRNVRNMLYSHK